MDIDITKDDLSDFEGKGPAFVTFGETMIRDTPADEQRLEMTRRVHISMGGSEFSVAVFLARFGIPSAYVTRVPDNPYGWQLRNIARAHGVLADHFVWADKVEPFGRYLYEIGQTPRKNVAWYQRMFSAASRLAPGDVDWSTALRDCRIFHSSGISFGLAIHSGYDRNHLLEAFKEAQQAKPEGCLVGCDFNYRSTLWSEEECVEVMTPLITDHVDILITGVHEMARFYGIDCGRYSSEEILQGDYERLSDEDLQSFCNELINRFDLKIAAATLRHPDSLEKQRWEVAAGMGQDTFARSSAPKPFVIRDRLGGGDAWNGGFYYGLLMQGINAQGLRKGIVVGDAAARLQPTFMFDLPILSRHGVQELIESDGADTGLQTER